MDRMNLYVCIPCVKMRSAPGLCPVCSQELTEYIPASEAPQPAPAPEAPKPTDEKMLSEAAAELGRRGGAKNKGQSTPARKATAPINGKKGGAGKHKEPPSKRALARIGKSDTAYAIVKDMVIQFAGEKAAAEEYLKQNPQ